MRLNVIPINKRYYKLHKNENVFFFFFTQHREEHIQYIHTQVGSTAHIFHIFFFFLS